MKISYTRKKRNITKRIVDKISKLEPVSPEQLMRRTRGRKIGDDGNIKIDTHMGVVNDFLSCKFTLRAIAFRNKTSESQVRNIINRHLPKEVIKIVKLIRKYRYGFNEYMNEKYDYLCYEPK